MAGATGLEPAASAVTGQRSNQLSYAPQPKERDVASIQLKSQRENWTSKPALLQNLRNKTAVEELRRLVLLRRNAKGLCLLAKVEQGSWIG